MTKVDTVFCLVRHIFRRLKCLFHQIIRESPNFGTHFSLSRPRASLIIVSFPSTRMHLALTLVCPGPARNK